MLDECCHYSLRSHFYMVRSINIFQWESSRWFIETPFENSTLNHLFWKWTMLIWKKLIYTSSGVMTDQMNKRRWLWAKLPCDRRPFKLTANGRRGGLRMWMPRHSGVYTFRSYCTFSSPVTATQPDNTNKLKSSTNWYLTNSFIHYNWRTQTFWSYSI